MSKLMRASKWVQREFEDGSQPDNRTIRRWVENGKLKGKVVDGVVWVCSSEQWGVSSDVSHAVRQLINEG